MRPAPSNEHVADIYEFKLAPTAKVPRAAGTGKLALVWSPFTIAVSADGHLIYDVEITVTSLPDPSRLGPYQTYVVWVASPNLDRVERIGTITPSGALRARLTNWNKFLVLVTAEAHPDTERRTGPVLLQGRSPSGLMASFQSHELFSNIPH